MNMCEKLIKKIFHSFQKQIVDKKIKYRSTGCPKNPLGKFSSISPMVHKQLNSLFYRMIVYSLKFYFISFGLQQMFKMITITLNT